MNSQLMLCHLLIFCEGPVDSRPELRQLYHRKARHREHYHQRLYYIGYAGGHAGSRLHGGRAHPKRCKEYRHEHGGYRVELAYQRHGYAVKAVARGIAVYEEELCAEYFCAAAQPRYHAGYEEAEEEVLLHREAVESGGSHVETHRP